MISFLVIHFNWTLLLKDLKSINAFFFNIRSTNAAFYTAGNGKGMIWLDEVNCTKTAAGLDMCRHLGWGIHNCGHSEDVGVRCYGGYETFTGIVTDF